MCLLVKFQSKIRTRLPVSTPPTSRRSGRALCKTPSREPAPVRDKTAVFLDRDGTIIVDGHYISDPSQVKLLAGVREALGLLRDSGHLLFLFTNQSGVGRGLFPLTAVHHCNRRMLELLDLGDDLFRNICIAPETPDQPQIYRKPSPRFITESITAHGLDRSRSWMVGDKPSDVEAGLNAGIQAALIASAGMNENPAVHHYHSLLAFAQAIAHRSD